ncbi:MAG: transglutaminase domain-containing protein [Pirellulaceae bacterium]
MRLRFRHPSHGLLLAGLLLLSLNCVGRVHYSEVPNSHPQRLDAHPRTLSESAFWEQVPRRPQETDERYAARLAGLVSDRMVLIDPRFAKPTLCENWVLWLYAQYLGYYEWLDTHRAVRMGGGFCSQHAIVYNNILRYQGLESRIVWLNGHVLNEVLVEGAWQVFDPDYDVAFGASLKELEADPDRAYGAYRGAGLSEAEARKFAEMFESERDNWHFKTSQHYASVAGYLVERLSFLVIWIIPIAFLAAGWLAHSWDAVVRWSTETRSRTALTGMALGPEATPWPT